MRYVIKYRLNSDGTIPPFLYTGNDGIGGIFPVDTNDHPSPRELLMIGISIDNPTGEFEIVSTKADLQSYLTIVGANWKNLDGSSFDPVAESNRVWGVLDQLNA